MRPGLAAIAAFSLLSGPAFAHDRRDEPAPELRDAPMTYPGGPDYGAAGYGGFDPAARDAWLADCRHRLSARDSGVGGAVMGGVVGGIAGNRIAGRHDRTMGTIAGAVVGAVAGAAIDKAEDGRRNRDECEAYLEDYYASFTRGGGYPTYVPGYGAPYVYAYPQDYRPAYSYAAPGCCMAPAMVPAMMVPIAQPKPHCTETVEYVYEDVPVRPARRSIPRRAKTVPDKRVKIAPEKLIRRE